MAYGDGTLYQRGGVEYCSTSTPVWASRVSGGCGLLEATGRIVAVLP